VGGGNSSGVGRKKIEQKTRVQGKLKMGPKKRKFCMGSRGRPTVGGSEKLVEFKDIRKWRAELEEL